MAASCQQQFILGNFLKDVLPDYLTCGYCAREFLLDNITLFIAHKIRGCDKNSFIRTTSLPGGKETWTSLTCSSCSRVFMTARGLLHHVQEDHQMFLYLQSNPSNDPPETGLKPRPAHTTVNFTDFITADKPGCFFHDCGIKSSYDPPEEPTDLSLPSTESVSRSVVKHEPHPEIEPINSSEFNVVYRPEPGVPKKRKFFLEENDLELNSDVIFPILSSSTGSCPDVNKKDKRVRVNSLVLEHTNDKILTEGNCYKREDSLCYMAEDTSCAMFQSSETSGHDKHKNLKRLLQNNTKLCEPEEPCIHFNDIYTKPDIDNKSSIKEVPTRKSVLLKAPTENDTREPPTIKTYDLSRIESITSASIKSPIYETCNMENGLLSKQRIEYFKMAPSFLEKNKNGCDILSLRGSNSPDMSELIQETATDLSMKTSLGVQFFQSSNEKIHDIPNKLFDRNVYLFHNAALDGSIADAAQKKTLKDISDYARSNSPLTNSAKISHEIGCASLEQYSVQKCHEIDCHNKKQYSVKSAHEKNKKNENITVSNSHEIICRSSDNYYINDSFKVDNINEKYSANNSPEIATEKEKYSIKVSSETSSCNKETFSIKNSPEITHHNTQNYSVNKSGKIVSNINMDTFSVKTFPEIRKTDKVKFSNKNSPDICHPRIENSSLYNSTEITKANFQHHCLENFHELFNNQKDKLCDKNLHGLRNTTIEEYSVKISKEISTLNIEEIPVRNSYVDENNIENSITNEAKIPSAKKDNHSIKNSQEKVSTVLDKHHMRNHVINPISSTSVPSDPVISYEQNFAYQEGNNKWTASKRQYKSDNFSECDNFFSVLRFQENNSESKIYLGIGNLPSGKESSECINAGLKKQVEKRMMTPEANLTPDTCTKVGQQSVDTAVHENLDPVYMDTAEVKVLKKRRYPTSRPFKCVSCDQAFNQRIHLKKHLSKHTGVKPFKCQQCDYSTVERSHLKVHYRIHTGEKPYRCTFCDYATAQNSTLKIHLKRHHEGQLLPDIIRQGDNSRHGCSPEREDWPLQEAFLLNFQSSRQQGRDLSRSSSVLS